jgi:hypothetical protein
MYYHKMLDICETPKPVYKITPICISLAQDVGHCEINEKTTTFAPVLLL